MLAAVLKGFNDLVLEEVPAPEPGTNEVVIRVKACGICATDYKAIKGIRTNVTFPFIAGHEAAGVVAAVGPGVSHVKEGRMDASFGTTPLAMQKAIRLMERGLVDPEKIITHRFALADIHEAIKVMGRKDRNKVMINP
jgi:threonine dehydrogenase-like Zn-dependent dehydrogenase